MLFIAYYSGTGDLLLTRDVNNVITWRSRKLIDLELIHVDLLTSVVLYIWSPIDFVFLHS